MGLSELVDIQRTFDDHQRQLADHMETSSLLEVDVGELSSPVLRRLIEEVRNDIREDVSPYSRWHNRHNRSR